LGKPATGKPTMGTPAMTEPVIKLEKVSKRYWQIKERSLVRSLVPFGPPNRTEFWALHDVDLEIQRGETVGIIGRNGAGKSTLLRLIAGVSQPTSGRMAIRGRIAPLLSVGVGFHGEMSGRENIFVNGMLLGLTKPEIRRKFDEIVAFADLGDFIDTPVKFYSSGMFMRLGFSVAIHVIPDVLIVDEVLAVGDVAFQLRCLERMRDLQRSGTTIVFVSHHMHAVHLLCPRSVVINKGRRDYDGPTEIAIARYHLLLAAADENIVGAPVRILRRELVDQHGVAVDDVEQDQVITYLLGVRFEVPVDGPGLIFKVFAGDGSLAYTMQTALGDRWRSYATGEEAEVRVNFRLRLGGGGTFHINTDVTDSESTVLFSDPNGPSFFVPPLLGVTGPADLEATILMDGDVRTNHTWERLPDPAKELPGRPTT
jgi:ABC-type polysaccharide/polyol phosphate transport system ATPase subunit